MRKNAEPNPANQVTMNNLSELNQTVSRDFERRICELSDFADKLCAFFLYKYDETKQLSSAFGTVIADFPKILQKTHDEMLPQNRDRIHYLFEELQVFDKATTSDLLFEKLASHGVALSERDFLHPQDKPEIIAYVKNSLADEAFDVFSESFSDPRLQYIASFNEGVSLLLSGQVGYCLFPLEERGGIRLSTVEKILHDHNLKIAGVTPVFGFDGNAELTYALVSTSLRISEYDKEDDRYFEIRLPKTPGKLAEFLMAVRAFHVEVFRINTSTFVNDFENESYYTIVFKRTGGEFDKLLCYLSLFEPDFTPVGIYLNLES